MVTEDSFEFIDHTNITEAQVAKETSERTISALLYERDGYQKRLANADGDKDLTQALTADIASVNDSLSSMAEYREPRNSVRK
jgi:hypothetical protein